MIHYVVSTDKKWIDILIAFHIFSRIIFGFFARARFNAEKTQFAYCFFSNVPWKPSFLGHIHLALRSIFYNEAVFLWVCHSVNVLAFLETTTSLFSIPTSLTLGNHLFIFSEFSKCACFFRDCYFYFFYSYFSHTRHFSFFPDVCNLYVQTCKEH